MRRSTLWNTITHSTLKYMQCTTKIFIDVISIFDIRIYGALHYTLKYAGWYDFSYHHYSIFRDILRQTQNEKSHWWREKRSTLTPRFIYIHISLALQQATNSYNQTTSHSIAEGSVCSVYGQVVHRRGQLVLLLLQFHISQTYSMHSSF